MANFDNINPAKIKINRENRQRRELRNIAELAESIAKHGLLNPIIVDGELCLIAGERRLEAVKKLGLPTIAIQYFADITDAKKQIIELEENIRRSNMTWQDECLAFYKIHTIFSDETGMANLAETALELNIHSSDLTDRINVAKALIAGESYVIECDHYTTARSYLRRKREREKAAEIDEIVGHQITPVTASETPTNAAKTPEQAVPIINADFVEWSKTYKKQPFNFIHCDFPYGINLTKMDKAAKMHKYADSFQIYENLLNALEASMRHVVAKSAHMLFWFSMRHYNYTKNRLEAMGWEVLHVPLIWEKGGSGIMPNQSYGLKWGYETAFHCTRGKRPIVKPVSNIINHKVKNAFHPSQKSGAALLHFFRIYIDRNSRMLDPTCGSGVSVRAAFESEASEVLGIEYDRQYYEDAVKNWNNHEA